MGAVERGRERPIVERVKKKAGNHESEIWNETGSQSVRCDHEPGGNELLSTHVKNICELVRKQTLYHCGDFLMMNES